jgi:ornithine decarboxylase
MASVRRFGHKSGMNLPVSPALEQFRSPADMVARLRPAEPVYCVNRAALVDAARRFVSLFPGRVLYAVKCNPLPLVMDALYEGGIRHFDTASIAEIEQVGRRYPDCSSYFMHPIKAPEAIERSFGEFGVRHFVVDHQGELEKMATVLGDRRRDTVAVIRLATPSKGAKFNLSAKFGAPPERAVALMRRAVEMGFQPGLCFHVGSQCVDPKAWTVALDLTRQVLAEAQVPIRCLDVGGGFPADYPGETPPPLEDFMAAIRNGVDALTLPADCILMCEPGRALVAGSTSLVVRIELATDDAVHINDGIYGSLVGATIGIRWPVSLLRPDAPVANATRPFRVFGPTCDNLDTLPFSFELPTDTRTGDFIRIDRLGAYSAALRTGFNGFLPNRFVLVDRLD